MQDQPKHSWLAAIPLACLLAAPPAGAAGFIALGVLPGYTSSSARAVSADGQAVAGFSTSGAQEPQATRWTSAGGLAGLGDLPGATVFSEGAGISADGSVVTGTGTVAPIVTGFRSFRWTAGSGPVELSGLPAGVLYSVSVGISADGTVIAGNNNYDATSGGGSGGFLWTETGGFIALGGTAANPAVPAHEVTGVSPSGERVVGRAAFFGGASQAFYWSTAEGFVRLGDLPGGSPDSVARAVSADDSTVVGQGTSASGPEAFRWTAATGLVGLGDLAGGAFGSEATAVSADGRVVVGSSSSAIGDQAFIWTQAGGMRALFDVLVEQGATGLQGWRLATAWGISADGQWIVGDAWNSSAGRFEGYVAQVSPVPLPGAGVLLATALAAGLWRPGRRAGRRD